MERVRRRWWTTLISILAALMIAAAALSGLFQFAVLALPSYRSDLSAWVTESAGRPIQIGGINLVWRSFLPQIDLSDITMYSLDGKREALSAERLSLGFGLLRLATGDLTPTTVELAGLSLEVSVDAAGKIHIIGLDEAESAEKPDYTQWLKQISRFERLRLKDCEIELTAPHLPTPSMHLVLTTAQLSKTFSGADIRAELLPPAEYAKRIQIKGEIADPLDRPDQWAGNLTATVVDLLPQPWLRGRLLPDTQVLMDKAQLQAKATVAQGRVSALDVHLESGRLQVTHHQRNTVIESLDLLAQATPLNTGWQVQIAHVKTNGDNQLSANLRYQPAAQSDDYELAVDADLLRLDHLVPWLAYWHDATTVLSAIARSSGKVTELQLRLTQHSQVLAYALHAKLDQIALAATPEAPGFSQLSGELSSNETSGRFQLKGGPFSLSLPKAFRNAVPFETLAGVASWQRAPDGWQIKLPDFSWKLATTQGQGNMNLLLPDASAASPVLDLVAHFSASDVLPLKAYMPMHWGPNLHAWLDRAIVSGQVSRGDLAIRGPVADFPFDVRPTGAWKLDLDASRIKLAFLPEWPSIDQIGAHLLFKGNSLEVAANAGTIAGNPIESARAFIRDLHQPVLEIDGKVKGEMSKFYDFVRRSPLEKELAALMATTSAKGNGRVAVRLAIPLHDAGKTQVSGTVQLAGVDLLYKKLDRTISGIAGDIGFNAQGAFSEKLTGRFEDLDVTARIEAQPKTRGVIKADFDYVFNQEGKGASGYVPESIRHLINGGGHWRAELPLGVDGSGLTLLSDLQGIALALPEPLGKAPSQTVPLSLQIFEGAPGKLRVRVTYADRLSADIGLAKLASVWKTQGINLVLGGAAAPISTQPGVFVSGVVKELDLGVWGAVFKGAHNDELPLKKADLKIDRALFAGQAIRDVRTVFTPDAEGWNVHINGAGAEGDVLWKNAAGGTVYAHLKQLHLDFQSPDLASSAAETTAFDPARFPVFNVDCEHTYVGDQDFGNLTLITSRIPSGQRVDRLQMNFGKVLLNAQGDWKRESDLSSATLKFDLQSADAAGVLTALGFAANLDAKQSHFIGDLAWSPRAEGVSWALARGRINIDVKDGVLKTVEPGAGRVLGLLNFYTLPRRLTLDFGDVVKSGLAFDTIKGNFDLADGNANTTDLDIKGPSMNMEIRGRIGLSAQDLDQQVSVHPDYGSGLALGATAVGGPIAGVIVLLAQQILQKPLDQITEINYRITGPWDNPKIESGSGSPPATGSKP